MAQTNFIQTNTTVNVSTKCKVVVYPWVVDPAADNTSDQQLSEATRLDISSQVQRVSFSKTLGGVSGNFSIQLTNSPNYGSNDWKDILKRGYWLVIYMTQEGDLDTTPNVGVARVNASERSKIRGICYIERAGIKVMTTDDRGATDMGYEISGRDFGIIYEESTAWHNLFKYDSLTLTAIKNLYLNIVGYVSIQKALSVIHDLFFFPSNLPGINNSESLLSIGLQWLLPKEMLLDIGFNLSGLSRGTYWGALPGVKNFSSTGFNIAIANPTDLLSGNCWEKLRNISIPQFHELFCETTPSGLPQLIFRPIPWAIDTSNYPTLSANNQIQLYRNLTPVTITSSESLISYDLGEDDHSRYNSFLVTLETSLVNVADNITYLFGSRFPLFEYSSIKRHGFRPMHVTIDSFVNNDELANGAVDRTLALECNELNFDYWNQAIYAESGTIEQVGANTIKIGTVLKFTQDNPYLFNKRYYIEGYTDTFTVDGKGAGFWIQEIMVTRGFDETALANKTGFSGRNEPFTKPGEFTPSGSYTGKT